MSDRRPKPQHLNTPTPRRRHDGKELVRRQFGANAEAYVRSAVHGHAPSLARLVEVARPRADWRVLDVSTGGGHTALAFAPHVRQVVATDLSSEMLAAAERFAGERGVTNVEFQTADAEALPFPDASFDLVTNRIALHHYPEPRRAIAGMARVLRAGGLLVLVDNVVPPDRQTAGYVNAVEKLRDPSHQWCFPRVRLETYLTEAGLTVEHAEDSYKEMDFEDWADRMGCDAPKKEKLRSLICDAPEEARAHFHPRLEGDRLRFSLGETLLAARRPE